MPRQRFANPVPGGTVTPRTDQGVDVVGRPGGQVDAIANSVAVGRIRNWYKGQPFEWFRILGTNTYWYVSEQVTNLVRPGTKVKRGHRVADVAASGTGIEVGWATRGGQTLAASRGHVTPGSHYSPEGLNFRQRVFGGGSINQAPVSSPPLGHFLATAYGPPWGGIEGTGVTARGTKLPGKPTGRVGPPYLVAVDPKVIPLGTKLKIWPNPTHNPNTIWTADDTGGAIKGNRIDFLILTGRAAQNRWGRTPVTIWRADAAGAGPNVGTPGGGGRVRPGGGNDGAAVDALFTQYQSARDQWTQPQANANDVSFSLPGVIGGPLNPFNWLTGASDAISSVTDFLKALAWITLPRNWLRMFEVFLGFVLFLFGLHASFQAIGEAREGYTTGELALTRSGLGRVINAAASTVPETRASRAIAGGRKRVGTAPHKTRRTALRVRYGREERVAELKKKSGNDIPRKRRAKKN